MAFRLNKAQQTAVTHLGSPLLVLAGAGSGKTGVITQRIRWLIEQNHAAAAQIVAVTFTNKASREMMARMRQLLGKKKCADLRVSTFHRFGLGVIREQFEAMGYQRGFTIIDPHDAQITVAELLRSEADSDSAFLDRVVGRISSWKNRGLVAAPVIAEDDPVGRAAAEVWPDYERRLKACNSLDLDDLILKPTELLKSSESVRDHYRRSIRFLLVDEYQDTNGAQYELIRQIAGRGDGLTVVGDDDQSIYGWRGAQPENLATLADDFSGLEVIKLEQNYRCSGRVLSVANALIGNNPRLYEKNLWSEGIFGDPVRVLSAPTDVAEAARVASDMMSHRFQNNTAWGDYAILYRGNHQARVLEQHLREFDIPYTVSGGPSFFDRSEVRDVMAYMRLLVNQSDDAAFLRIVNRPRRGIGTTSLEVLVEFASAQRVPLFEAAAHEDLGTAIKSRPLALLRQFVDWIVSYAERAVDAAPGPLLAELLEEMGYCGWLVENSQQANDGEKRAENVNELVAWIGRLGDRGQALEEVVSSLLLAGILENRDEEPENSVSLMTLHSAKGLEFGFVYIVGLEEGLLPHRTSIDNDEVVEERRLMYVGITRAKQALTLSFANARRRQGGVEQNEPSRFFEEMPEQDLAWADDAERRTVETGNAHMANIRKLLDANSA